MADNTIDSLTLEISSNSEGAEKALDKLVDSFTKLQKSLGGFKGFEEAYSGLKKLGNISTALNSDKVDRYASAMGKLSCSIKDFSKAGANIDSTIRNLGKLSEFDFSRLQISGDFTGLRNLVKGSGKFAEAAIKLAAVKPTEINRAVKAIEKLGNINLSGIAQGLNALKGTDTTVLNDFGATFQGFTSSLAGAEKVSAGISKLFSSLAQMSASADNMSIVQNSLPGVSTEIRKFIDTMATSPSISEEISSVISALSGISSAGNKIQKTVSLLPDLTAGIQAFIQSLSDVPKLNNDVVKVVESLAKIAPAGAKAGTAARNLQKNIQSLSGSMAGLEKNSERGLTGVKGFSSQLFSAMGIVGGIYGIISGIKNAINYSSDLAEAQNVVVQGFGALSYMADDFASNSVWLFGISSLSAKKMSGQFAAMARSLGVVPERATEMALSLTGLAGDLASFWNVSHDVAQTALESVFTGETESLKKFAVVLTQANLQQFAYSKGINKSVSAMTQAEQAQLRYAYVMEATAAAHGDFSRTSAGWAGQVRILVGQFQNLAGIVGGGLKAAFLPVITVLNALIAKIISLANLIASFIGKLFGVKPQAASAGAGLSEMAESAGSLGNNMDAAAGGIGEIGDAAKKSQKSLNGFIAGWHEVNNMTSNEGVGDSGGGAGSGASLPDMAIPNKYQFTVEAEDQATPVLDRIISRAKELSVLFLTGFEVGRGNTEVFGDIQENILSIQTSLNKIFTDYKVVTSFNNMIDSLAYNAGIKSGAFVSVGATILDNITGGASIYLEEAKERIKEYLVKMFDITGETDTIVTNFIVAVSEILTVFRSDDAKQITADIIQIFSDGFMGVTQLAFRFGADVLGLILNPITENSEGFKEAISNTLAPLENILGTLADSFTRVWEEIDQMYEAHISPLFSSLSNGISEIIETLLGGYNEHIAPVLDSLSKKFTDVWQGTIEPLLSNFIGLLDDVADLVKTVWENILQPVVNWIAKNIMPIVAPVLENVGIVFLNTFEEIGKLFDAFITTARGVIQFIDGVFSGDWSKAWEGIKTTFKGIWDAMPDFIKTPIRTIVGFINSMINAVESGVNCVIRALNAMSFDVPDWIPGIGGETFGFDLNKISLPRIPQLARGGVLEKGQVGLLEGSGSEAVVPLEKNTKWISRVAATMSEEFGKYKLNTYVPKPARQFESYNLDRFRHDMRMERDVQMAEQQFEIRRQNQLLEKLIDVVEQKDLHIGDDDVFNATRRGQNRFQRRTFRTGWAGID